MRPDIDARCRKSAIARVGKPHADGTPAARHHVLTCAPRREPATSRQQRGNAFDAIAPRARRRLLPFHLAAVLLFLCLVAGQYDAATGFTRLIGFGDRFAATAVAEVTREYPFVYAHSDGYDGQFYAQLALRPLLAGADLDAALDSPAYRARRIGLPWFAWTIGAGQPAWILQAYALANVLAWLALAALLLRWIPPDGATALLAWAGALFGAGVMMSVGRALTDLPAALLIALAVRFAERGRLTGAVGAFAASLLTRDTSLLAAGLLAPARGNDRRAWLHAALAAVCALAPLLLWSFYVRLRFPDVPNADPANFQLPFVAMLSSLNTAWQALPQQGWLRFGARCLGTLGLCVQCAFLVACASRVRQERWWRVGIAFALLFTVLGAPVWEDYTAAARAMIPMNLAFNILLPRERPWSLPLCLAGNLPMLHGLVYLLPMAWFKLP